MKNDVLLLISLSIAFLLSLLQTPAWFDVARPDWLLLVYLYWVLAMPERYGLAIAAGLGLLEDIISGNPLGQHVILYGFVVLVFLLSYRRLRMQNAWSVAGIIALLLMLMHSLDAAIAAISLPAIQLNGAMIILPSLTSALLWPWLMVFSRGLRRRFGVVNPL